MKTFLYSLSVSLVVLSCTAVEEETKIIATSSWTAAYARAAGVKKIQMLAPSSMQHPSEYELQFDDIRKLKNAEMIIAGGYETLLDEIRIGLEIDSERIIQIKTDYNFDHMKSSILAIARKTGTGDQARKHIDEIQHVFEESRKSLQQSGITDNPVLVQFFMQSLARELGLNIAGVFGPEHLEAFHIKDLMSKEFTLVLDNFHNPVSKPLVESKEEAEVVCLINFPGAHGTTSLADVIRYNVDKILEAKLE